MQLFGKQKDRSGLSLVAQNNNDDKMLRQQHAKNANWDSSVMLGSKLTDQPG